MTQERSHIPVLLGAVLDALCPEGRAPARVIDGTLGAGGHSRALLEAGAGELLGLDLDLSALDIARQTLTLYGERAHLVHSSYAHMAQHAAALGWQQVDAILLDLGVSSMQVDRPERGFAFMQDGPLDMRFNPAGHTAPASELVNEWDERDLAEIFTRYGEEPQARKAARAIVQKRPLHTTRQLADVLVEALWQPRQKSKGQEGRKSIHPATRVFQALRIAVNDELNVIERALPAAIQLLSPGGRLAVISFHSLEDRIVKQTFKDAAEEIVSPPGMQLEEKRAIVRLVTRKPITADEDEIARNPRSRSAKLRVVEKL